MTVLWPVTTIRDALEPLVPGLAVEVLPEIDSTNSELMRRARDARLQPTLLVALRQSAGRGRLGRDWHSEPANARQALSASLMFSLGLVLSPVDWSGLSLAVGVAVAQGLHPEVRLKWPNDLWWRDRKLGGILIETASVGELRYAVVGVGINLQEPMASGFSTPAAWLGELQRDCDAPEVLRRIAPALVAAVKAFEQHGFAPFQGRYRQLDALSGVALTLSDGTEGVARGVDERGALLVHTAQGLRQITSAEVSVRVLRGPDYDTV